MKKAFCVAGICVMVLLLVSSCIGSSPSAEDNIKGNINISGAFAIYPLMTRWAEEYQRIHPGINFDIASVGAGKGMEDILAKKVDIGMISREISVEEEAQGVYPVPVAKDAVFALINEKNPALKELSERGLSREMLVKIFITGQIKTWGEAVGNPAIADEIHIYTRADICGAGATWGAYLGGVQDHLLGEKKFGDPGIVQAIQKDPLSIGYNNLIYAYGLGDVAPRGTVILTIDLNSNGQADPNEILDTVEKATNAVATGLYPAPPSRHLYLVTNGKPEGIVKDFLNWILTDGQVFVERTGYVNLTEEQLKTALTKVK